MNVRTLVIALVLLVNGLLLGQAYAAPAGEAKDAVMKVAKAYGIEQWDQIERLDFTFKVKLPNKDETVSRQWTWWPKQSKVTLHREGQDNVTYSRDEIGEDVAKELPQTDKHFINDHYWLLFPFQPVWSNPKVTDEGKAKLPIEEGQAQKLAVRYPSEGGYTPGDGYNLYVNQQGLLQQWQYLPGGEQSKAMAHTWEKHRRLGPIVVSLDHWGPDKKFHLWFSDVKAKLTSGETVTPQTMNQ